MRVMLINSTNDDVQKEYSNAIFPPLGLLYIASLLREKGHIVKIIDMFVLSIKKNYNYNILKQDIKDFKPDVVGVSCFSSNIKYAKKTLDTAKNVSSKIITIIGGYHITAVPDYIQKIDSADYGVYGEGEFTLLDFIECLSKNKSIKNIKGIIYKDKKEIKFKKRDYIKNLDILPLLAMDLVPMKLYQPSSAYYKQLPATAIVTSRGCPYNCIFCHKPIFGRNFRSHSAERVVNEIEQLNKDYGIRDFRIYDDTFTIDRKRVVKICNMLIKKNLGVTWNCASRVDTVDYELLKLMKKAGCYNIVFGVEAGSERILKFIKKGFSKERVKKVFRWTKELGIESSAYFILGLPTETKQEILETIKFSKEIDSDYALFGLTTPYPDTELYKLCKKHGKVNIGDWSNLKVPIDLKKTLPFVPNTVSEKELKKLYKKAHISFYFRLKYILNKTRIIIGSDKPLNKINRGIRTLIGRISTTKGKLKNEVLLGLKSQVSNSERG